MSRLESKRDAEGHELRPVYGISRDEMTDAVQPIGWARTPGQAAKLINKHLSETTGTLDVLRGGDLYFSTYLMAWFVEE